MSKIEGLGYLKYSGKLVEDGYMDARKSAEALMGFDDAIRYFIVNERPELKDIPLNIPVKVQKGSWEAILGGGLLIVGAAATAYATTAATTLAKNDFADIKTKDLLKSALRKLQGVMKLALHLNGFTKAVRQKFKQNNTMVSVLNEANQSLDVPTEHLKLYLQVNPKMFSNIAGVIEADRTLCIGVYEGEKAEEVEVQAARKYLFVDETEPTDVILPELEHGKKVELIGEIPKGNERSNSLGLIYKGYTLSCIPAKGSVVSHKDALFTKCKIKGIVDRSYKTGEPIEKKPRIIFDELDPIDDRDNLLFK